MINSDKAHLYQVLHHRRENILTEIHHLNGEDAILRSARGLHVIQDVHELKAAILNTLLADIAQFTQLMTAEIEGDPVPTFNEMLVKFECKSQEWNTGLRFEKKLNGKIIFVRSARQDT